MSSPKDEVKKQIEQNTIPLGKEDIQKRKQKVLIRFSQSTPSITIPEAQKIHDDLNLEDLDPEELPRKPSTPHPGKPK